MTRGLLPLVIAGALLATRSAHSQAVELQVIVNCHRHVLLDETFYKTLRADLAGATSAAFAGVASVRILDARTESIPAWDAVFHSGLRDLDRLGSTERAKSHFVDISVANGRFVVEARQSDGQIRWTGPQVRKGSTIQRSQLSRIITDLLVADFGLTARVLRSDGDRAAVATLAEWGMSDARLREWVAVGDVFAIVQVGAGRASEVPHAYFVATAHPESGQISGRIESRFAQPLAGWEQGHHRFIKLATRPDRVAMRVVGPDGTTPAEVQVRLSATGSTSGDAIKESGATRGGFFASTETYQRIAYATLLIGDRVLAKVPIPTLGGEPIKVEVRTEPGGELAALGDADGRALRNRAHDTLARLGQDTAELRTLMTEGKNRAALGRVTELVRQLDEDIARLAGDAATFRSRNKQVPLDDVDRTLRDLRQQLLALRDAKHRLDQSVTAASAPAAGEKRQVLQSLVARAEQEILDADYDKALATYDEALKQAKDWPEIKARRDALAAKWAIQSPQHGAARAFVFGEWSAMLTLEDTARLLDQAGTALATCKSVGDRLTPRRLHRGLVRAAGWAARRDEELRRQDGDDAAKQAEALKRLANRLRVLLDDAEKLINQPQ